MTRSTISRVVKVLEHWLPFWACLSGAAVPIRVFVDESACSVGSVCPALDAQLREIFDCVAAQEKRWRGKAPQRWFVN